MARVVAKGVAVREALTVGDALAVPVAPPEVHAVADAEGEPEINGDGELVVQPDAVLESEPE